MFLFCQSPGWLSYFPPCPPPTSPAHWACYCQDGCSYSVADSMKHIYQIHLLIVMFHLSRSSSSSNSSSNRSSFVCQLSFVVCLFVCLFLWLIVMFHPILVRLWFVPHLSLAFGWNKKLIVSPVIHPGIDVAVDARIRVCYCHYYYCHYCRRYWKTKIAPWIYPWRIPESDYSPACSMPWQPVVAYAVLSPAAADERRRRRMSWYIIIFFVYVSFRDPFFYRYYR